MIESLKRFTIGCLYGMGFAVGVAAVFAIIFCLGIAQIGSFVDEAATDTSSAPSRDNPRPSTADRVSVFVDYGSSALVVVSKKHAAAFVFGPAVEDGVSYRYRYVAKHAASESNGNGTVFEKYARSAGSSAAETRVEDVGSELFLKAGAISIEWSRRSESAGWFYYHPDEYKLFVIPSSDFARINLRGMLR